MHKLNDLFDADGFLRGPEWRRSDRKPDRKNRTAKTGSTPGAVWDDDEPEIENGPRGADA